MITGDQAADLLSVDQAASFHSCLRLPMIIDQVDQAADMRIVDQAALI